MVQRGLIWCGGFLSLSNIGMFQKLGTLQNPTLAGFVFPKDPGMS